MAHEAEEWLLDIYHCDRSTRSEGRNQDIPFID